MDVLIRKLRRVLGVIFSWPPPSHSAKSSSSQQQTLTYAASGVSIDAGNSLVQNIKPIVKATARSGSDSDIGGFGGLFDLKAAGFKDPILVSGTDGVGTKLIVAQSMGVHHTVGESQSLLLPRFSILILDP